MLSLVCTRLATATQFLFWAGGRTSLFTKRITIAPAKEVDGACKFYSAHVSKTLAGKQPVVPGRWLASSQWYPVQIPPARSVGLWQGGTALIPSLESRTMTSVLHCE